jgi:hypothetical protein
MFKYIDALNSLYPNKKFGIIDNNYDNLQWGEDSINKPSKLELDNEIVRLNILYPIHKNRREQYPSLEEQADMQYWDAINGTTTWQDAIKAVKDANPKPTS